MQGEEAVLYHRIKCTNHKARKKCESRSSMILAYRLLLTLINQMMHAYNELCSIGGQEHISSQITSLPLFNLAIVAIMYKSIVHIGLYHAVSLLHGQSVG